MDYVEEIFNKHYSREIRNYGAGVWTIKAAMTLKDFRAAVKDIEADHLKRVCETE